MNPRSTPITKRASRSQLALCGVIVLGAAVFFASAQSAYSFVLLPPPPSEGLALSIDLPTETLDSLGRGATSFSELAEGAAAAWNDVGVGLLPDDEFFTKSIPMQRNPCGGIDGINTVTFSETNCGFAWGDVLGITIRRWFEGDGVFEADVLFNETTEWDAYTGPIRVLPSIGQVEDFTRTALHEFGHALGLDHPDDFGQTVAAIMNSKATNIDRLQPDDRNGAHTVDYVPSTIDFQIDFTPPSQLIRPGSTAEFILSTATTFQSPTQSIDLFSLTGTCPPEATCNFTSLELTNASPVTYSVITTTDTVTGEYPLLIIGTAGGITRLAKGTLTVSTGVEEAPARVFVTVEDDQGAPIAETTIRVKHQITKEKVKGITDVNGEYVSPLLDPAEYKVICKKTGFKKDKEVITLTAGDEQTVNCILEPLLEVQ